MSRFQVGDRVVVVGERSYWNWDADRTLSIRGYLGTVEGVEWDEIQVSLNNDPIPDGEPWCFTEDELELAQRTPGPDADAKALDTLALLWRVLAGADANLSAKGIETVREILTTTGRDAG